MTDWTSLVVAVVGVSGTASTAVIAQRYALAGRKLDAQVQRDERNDERADAARREAADAMAALYSELNTKARHYRAAIRGGFAHHLGDRIDPDVFDELEVARQAFAECNSRAQMLIPREILARATIASVALGDGYRACRPDLTESEAEELGRDIRAAVNALRDAMRVELGVDAPPDSDMD